MECSFMSLLGILMLWKLVCSIYQFILDVAKPWSVDVKKRYGEGGWALITDSTDGIGYGFAKSFAKRGMNVIITGTSEEKLAERRDSLEKLFPSITIHSILIDFTKCAEPYFCSELKKDIGGREISILVNNVETLDHSQLGIASFEKTKDTIRVNMMAQSLMLNCFLEDLNSRESKSAVIDVSSVLATKETGVLSLYTASKAFNRFLNLGLASSDNFKNVDFLCLKPFITSDQMRNKKNDSRFVVEPDECSEGCIRSLGVVDESYGSVRHAIYGHAIQLVYFLLPTILAEYIRVYIRLKVVQT